MEIKGSSFLYGQTGLQNSQQKLDQASRKVADATAQSLSNDQSSDKSLYGSKLQDGLIEANMSELEFQANAKTIEASDKTIGTLIDTKA